MTDVTFYISGLPYNSGGTAYSSTVSAEPVGGTAPYSYSWGILNNFSTGSASGASVYAYTTYIDGTHTLTGGFGVTVTDANGTSIYRSITGLYITY